MRKFFVIRAFNANLEQYGWRNWQSAVMEADSAKALAMYMKDQGIFTTVLPVSMVSNADWSDLA